MVPLDGLEPPRLSATEFEYDSVGGHMLYRLAIDQQNQSFISTFIALRTIVFGIPWYPVVSRWYPVGIPETDH